MNERINWIDWGKTIAVVTVVFCHLPQSQEWFYYRYLQACIITIFFFISGYLKKDRESDKENWKKYWNSLILPYMIYNIIVYPYWFIKYYMLNGDMPDIFAALKPIIGALLFEHESSFAEPLNGPLWYIPAILFMHIIIDQCRKTNYLHHIMILLCVISFFLYAANKQWGFMHAMTPTGIFRRLPYYYLGYVMGRLHLFKKTSFSIDLLGFTCFIPLSILFFYLHLNEERIMPHVLLFYPFNLSFLFGFLHGCKLLSAFKSEAIVNLSIGTLLIIGVHFPLIGIYNYLTGHTGYHWYEAIPTTLLITVILYPLILLAKYHAPLLLGRKSSSWNRLKE